MNKAKTLLKHYAAEESGASAVEFVLHQITDLNQGIEELGRNISARRPKGK